MSEWCKLKLTKKGLNFFLRVSLPFHYFHNALCRYRTSIQGEKFSISACKLWWFGFDLDTNTNVSKFFQKMPKFSHLIWKLKPTHIGFTLQFQRVFLYHRRVNVKSLCVKMFQDFFQHVHRDRLRQKWKRVELFQPSHVGKTSWSWLLFVINPRCCVKQS